MASGSGVGGVAFRGRRGSFARNLARNISEYTPDWYSDQGVTAAENNQWSFEVAWEVANKGRVNRFLLTLFVQNYRIFTLRVSVWIFSSRQHIA